MADFILDSRLASDTFAVATLALCDLRLMKDARFPWLLLVPRKAGAAEIIDLDMAERAELLSEIASVSTALKTVTQCHKLNVAALGNVVRQLHVHVIARFENDAAWPKPVWGVGEAIAYDEATRDRLIGRLRAALPA
jgi:diadenosine tetraphosphate (Ap4A) HIT family hydrolase